MSKSLYSWWAKYMFWSQTHGWPFGQPAPPDPSPYPGTVLILGHRGSSHNYPENTMLAFEKAVEEGAHGIETDIWKTSDDVYVLIHDSTVDRTTNGTGSVSSLTWDEISELDAGSWKGPQFADREDCKIPRLDDFLDYYKSEPVFLCLQVKIGIDDCKAIIDMVVEREMEDQCFIFTDKSRLATLKTYAPDVFVMNDGTSHEPWTLLNQAQSEGWNAISPGWDKVTRELAEAANGAGIWVMASYLQSGYTVRTNSLIDAGCNFILGNDCAAMVNVANNRGIVQATPPLSAIEPNGDS